MKAFAKLLPPLAVVGALTLIPVTTSSLAAADADTMKELDTFMDVFNQVRASYVDPVDDHTLIKGAIDGMLSIKNVTPKTIGEEEYKKKRVYFQTKALGGYPFVGTPDRIADEFAILSRAGIRGIAFSLINYLDELPYIRDEVLPRLARAGVRAPVH